MSIWTQAQYEQFSGAIQKSSVKLAFNVLFYTGMRSGELPAFTSADIHKITKSALDKEIKRIAAKMGLPIIRVHDLRHLYVKPTTKNISL